MFCAEFVLLLCQINAVMQVSESILSFATIHHGSFKKKELAEYLSSSSDINDTSLNTLLARLVSSGRLVKVGWGEYALPQGGKYKWVILPQPGTVDLACKLKKRYPLADFCVWDASCVVPFMLHVPNVKMTIIDVERFLLQTFFDAIKEMCPDQAVLLSPTEDEYYKYGSNRDCIVVNPLYTESPLEIVDGIVVPTAEKVLVDIVANPEFFYLQGSEATTIYSNVLRDCYISIPRLKRYARRRRCLDKVQKRLNNIDYANND